MILVGLDDTDIVDHPGTNQLARHISYSLDGDFHCRMIVRHQLLFDPRVPYTSKNGSASMWMEPRGYMPISMLINRLRTLIIDWAPAGSDPGFCVAEGVAEEVTAFARRCQQELVTQEEARAVAARHDLHLEGLGGTEGGVIGALAAVGLAATRESGRVVHRSPTKQDYYTVSGRISIEELYDHGIESVLRQSTCEPLAVGDVQLRKRLRPNLRAGKVVLYVEPAAEPWADGPCWEAVKVV